jgi:glycosyltransferase involved in cell wall biosynthesis
MEDSSFRVLIVAELSNKMLDSFISQILSVESVNLCVLRSKPGIARENVTYICPPYALGKNRALSTFWKILYSFRLLLDRKYTCVYAIFAHPHLYIAALIAFLSRKPLFYSIIASYFELVGKQSILGKLTLKIARRTNKVMVSGERAIEYLIAQGVHPKNIVEYSVIEHASLEDFVPLGSDKPFDLVVLSRLNKDKNIGTFIDIVASLKESNPSIKAAIIGDGMVRKELESYSISLGLSKNIKFFGYVQSAQDVNRILNSAKIFVLNSKHEGGPFTVLEAMAAGLCVVSSDVGEVRRAIKNEWNGFIVPRCDDVEAYVRIIAQLLENPKKLEEIQQRAAQIKEKDANRVVRMFWKQAVAASKTEL